MTRPPRLELTWIGKEHRPKLEPRILLEDPEKSYHSAHRVSDGDIFDNRLPFGDDLLATGAAMAATRELVEKLGGNIAAIGTLIELEFLDGRARLGGRPFYSFVRYRGVFRSG